MKAIHWIIAAAAFAFVQAAPASAGVNDPEIFIYRGAGINDTGGAAFSGNATAFLCTNFSGATENIRVVVRNRDTSLVANQAISIGHLQTVAVLTKETALFLSAFRTILNTGTVPHGTVAIAATSINVTCTAMLVDAHASTPNGIKLHMTRFNPIPGSQE